MKWVVCALFMLSLSGCVGNDDDSGQSLLDSALGPYHYKWRDGGEFWSSDNATLHLYDEDYRKVGAYNLTSEKQTIKADAAYMWLDKDARHSGLMMAFMDRDLENTVLLEQGFQEIPDLGLGIDVELQQAPFADFLTLETDGLPFTLDAYFHGSVSQFEMEIRSPLGLVYEASFFGNSAILLGNSETIDLEGTFYPENASGTRYDVLVKADHLDGFLSITHQELAHKYRGHRFLETDVEDVAFVYGATNVPVKVELAQDAEWLILRAPENRSAHLVIWDGEIVGEATVSGTKAIPASSTEYWVAPLNGVDVIIGTDVVPASFDMVPLEIVETVFSTEQWASNDRQRSGSENVTLPGIPYLDRMEFSDGYAGSCLSYGALKILDQNQTYAATAPGWGHTGYIWNAKGITVEYSTTNRPCTYWGIVVTSFVL